MELNLDTGLRQPIEELLARGHTPPFVVFCNTMAYAPGEFDTELGKVIVHSSYTHQPVEDLSVTTLTAWEAYLAGQDQPADEDAAS